MDPNHCFSCGNRLDEPLSEGHTLGRCSGCRSDAEAYGAALGGLDTMPPPWFRGAVALCEPLLGWPTAITLLSLDLWDSFVVLHYVIEVPPGRRRVPEPHKWTLATAAGTVHHSGAGGGGTPGTDRFLAWDFTLAPSMPDEAGLVHVLAQAPGASAEGTIDLSTCRPTRRPAVIGLSGARVESDPECPSCGPPLPPLPPVQRPPGFELDWAIPAPPEPEPEPDLVAERRPLCSACSSNLDTVIAAKDPIRPRPDRVIALGAELGPLFGADLVVPSLAVWPTFFDLTIVGPSLGAWAAGLFGRRAKRWTAHDDHGRHYRGADLAGGTGVGLTSKDLTFVPALAPDATTLTVTFPASYDGTQPRATLDLTS